MQSDDFGNIGFRSKYEFEILTEIASRYYFKLRDGDMINKYYQENLFDGFMILDILILSMKGLVIKTGIIDRTGLRK